MTKKIFKCQEEKESYLKGYKGLPVPEDLLDSELMLLIYVQGLEDRVAQLSKLQDSGVPIKQELFETAGMYIDEANSLIYKWQTLCSSSFVSFAGPSKIDLTIFKKT